MSTISSDPNAPLPLCATPKPSLDWSREGTPASDDFGDIYFSTDGGLDESKAVFLQGCHVQRAWENLPPNGVHTIGELGFGSGLNFLACLDHWQKTEQNRAENTRLHFISIEKFAWSRQELSRALAYFPKLAPFIDGLLAQWPGRIKGVHRLHFGTASLTLFHMDVDPALAQMDARIDAWFLDGFSPAKNSAMWSDHVFEQIAKLSNPHASLASFSVAGFVRQGLSDNGFTVEKKPGFGRKRHRLEARFQPSSIEPDHHDITPPLDPNLSPIIIGAGIGGASIARAYQRRNITPTLIDPNLGQTHQSGASFNPAAMVMPRLDLQDRPESRFFNAAYHYALNQYQALDAVLSSGVEQIPKTEKEQVRFSRLLSQAPIPPSHLTQSEAHEGGVFFAQAAIISPVDVLDQCRADCDIVSQAVTQIKNINQVWHVYHGGQLLARSNRVHICIGANILAIEPVSVRFTKGQVCWSETDKSILQQAFMSEIYGCDQSGGVLIGATHHHVGPGQDNQTSDDDTRELVDKFGDHIGAHDLKLIPAPFEDWKSRASIRVTTKDTLPISYHDHGGKYVLSGLGSRGFMVAPLLGELQVAQSLGECLPLAKNQIERFLNKPE